MRDILQACKKKFHVFAQFIQDKFIALTTPSKQFTLATGTISDLPRSKSQTKGLPGYRVAQSIAI